MLHTYSLYLIVSSFVWCWAGFSYDYHSPTLWLLSVKLTCVVRTDSGHMAWGKGAACEKLHPSTRLSLYIIESVQKYLVSIYYVPA